LLVLIELRRWKRRWTSPLQVDYHLTAMGAHRYERHFRMRAVGLAAFVAVSCLAWGLAASAQASPVPVIESESATHIESTDVTLEAKIDTHGLYTAYELQIDTNGSYNYTKADCPLPVPGFAQCESITDGPPLPSGLVEPQPEHIPAGSGDQMVSLALAGIGATLQPSTTYHFRVIVSNGGQEVQGPDETFTTPAAGSPVIESLSASNVTQNDATLEAQIDPEGLETTYELWMEDPCKPPMECIRVPQLLTGSIPAGTSSESLSIDLQSSGKHLNIEPGMTYGYWVIAKNADGTVEEQRVFKTLAANTPKVDSESVSNITPTDATIEAQIDTEGLETSYQFQLWSICGGKGACDIVINYPLPSGLLLGSFIDQSVSLDLNSAGVTLQPGGTYFYTVSATSSAGMTEAPTQRFTTPEDTVQPLGTTTSPLSGAGQAAGPNNTSTSGGDQPAASGGSSSSSTPGVKSLGPAVGKTTKLGSPTNAQKLAKALKACEKKLKSERAACAKQAHKKYGTTASRAKKE
jgi:hypothetical protein